MSENKLNWPVPDELDMALLLRAGLNLGIMGAVYAAHDQEHITWITEEGRRIAQITPPGAITVTRDQVNGIMLRYWPGTDWERAAQQVWDELNDRQEAP